MENKINIAELLKDCPKGMELDCTMYEDVYFDYVDELNIIHCYIQYETHKTSTTFNQHGTPNSNIKSKCVIFPKGKTTWEGFVPPCKFKAGDVLVSKAGNIVLFSHIDSKNIVHYHCIIQPYDSFRIEENTSIGVGKYYECVLANEQQRQRMYDKIKCSGYKYNQSTNKLEKLIKPKFKIGDKITNGKTSIIISYIDNEYYYNVGRNIATRLFIKNQDDWELVKPKFKVGDKVKDKNNFIYTVLSIEGWGYILDDIHRTGVAFRDQDNYELVPNKFDITTLKPFDKVLVRDNSEQKWTVDMFSFYDKNLIYPFVCVGHYTNQCIPYEQNKHLLGTTDDCDEYYKTWK